MLELERLEFSNWLAFGEGCVVDFTENKVTLLSGKNGAGKSSIPTILEEMLYNKNSRDFKKTQLLNRDSLSYSGTLYFSVDGDKYKLTKTVKSTAKVTLLKNGVDISGNTATVTYKILEDILGKDFTSFTKLVYQSMTSSLDFLTLTDAKRKEFLVSLLNLEVYTEIESEIKADIKDTQTALLAVDAAISELKPYTAEITDMELVVEEVEEVIEDYSLVDKLIADRDLISQESAVLAVEIQEYDKNLKIAKNRFTDANNKIINYSNTVSGLNATILNLTASKPTQPSDTDYSQLQSITRELMELRINLDNIKKQYNHFRDDSKHTNCPVCNSSLDKSESYAAAVRLRDEYKNTKVEFEMLESEHDRLVQIRQATQTYNDWENTIKEVESKLDKYKSDNDYEQLKSDMLLAEKEYKDLMFSPLRGKEERQKQLKSDIKNLTVKIEKTQAKNRQLISEYNAKLVANAKAIEFNRALEERKQVRLEFCSKLLSKERERRELQDTVAELQVLQKAVKDLISYRIEYASKSFESAINDYLVKLSEGNLALQFTLDNAKLGITVFNEGASVDVNTLSTGELLMTKLATLLAIRKMDTNHINVLFLDEVASTLTEENKDILVKTLLEEPYNTFVVNHSYDNPLCAKLHVEKGRPSRIIK